MFPSMTRFGQIIKRALERKAHSAEFPAILGNSSGTVLTDADGIVYATKWSGEVIQVLNRRVPNKPYKHVIIGYDPTQPGVLQVLRERDVFGALDTDPAVPDHAQTHAYGGGDTDFVEGMRVMPFLVLPYADLTVQIFGGTFPKADGTAGVVSNQTLDLSAYQPSAGAKYALIQHDDDGVISVVEGAEVDVKELLTVADIPTATETPFCAVRLYDGQTTLQLDPNGLIDIIDLRWGGPVGGGGGTGTGTGVIQRNLDDDLSMADGTCLILKSYLDLNDYDLHLQGDADLVIL